MDRLERVKAEVERRIAEQQKWIDAQYGGHEESVKEELVELLSFIDSMQEESVSKVWHYQKEEPVSEIADKSRPIVVVYGHNSLDAAGKFCCYEDNSDAIWLSNNYEKWAFIEDLLYKQEEPVSNNLEEEIIRYIGYSQEVDEDVSTTMIRKAARHFANWQKKQTISKACDWLRSNIDCSMWIMDFKKHLEK